jgi:hypothetical protein
VTWFVIGAMLLVFIVANWMDNVLKELRKISTELELARIRNTQELEIARIQNNRKVGS